MKALVGAAVASVVFGCGAALGATWSTGESHIDPAPVIRTVAVVRSPREFRYAGFRCWAVTKGTGDTVECMRVGGGLAVMEGARGTEALTLLVNAAGFPRKVIADCKLAELGGVATWMGGRC